MSITKTVFGETKDHQIVNVFRFENSSHAYVDILDYGCRILSICVPDKNKNFRDIALGYQTVGDYESDTASLGAIVGRYANRICKGKFTLNGTDYQLAINNGENALHGGPTGFYHRVFQSEILDDEHVKFTHFSTDGEEGYPGNLTFSVTYGWSDDCELSISYEASSDRDTIINFTNHTYFNLNGHASGTILDHELQIDADYYTPTDTTQIPTGHIVPVGSSAFDFRAGKKIGQDINADEEQLNMVNHTYDHNLVVNGTGFREAAVLQSDESGIRMTCFTDQPGIQIYVVDYPLPIKGKGDVSYTPFCSVCLETQHYPDSINHPSFPSVILKANETFKSLTSYHFSTMNN